MLADVNIESNSEAATAGFTVFQRYAQIYANLCRKTVATLGDPSGRPYNHSILMAVPINRWNREC